MKLFHLLKAEEKVNPGPNVTSKERGVQQLLTRHPFNGVRSQQGFPLKIGHMVRNYIEIVFKHDLGGLVH